MDGYAFTARGVSYGDELMVVGESLAGHPYTGRVDEGQCVRITTGAAVPSSTDTIIIQENTERNGKLVRLLTVPDRGQNIRATGHDVLGGKEVCSAGTRLNPFDLGWLAACGITELTVRGKPRVAVFSTGDELVAPGSPLNRGQIYDANRALLNTMLSNLPVDVTDLGILADNRQGIEAALRSASESCDLLLTSGGVSVGDADYVREVVEALGKIELWRLNLKPGKPLAFGSIGHSIFLGLPGNPVSAIVTYLLIAQPLLLKMAGGRPAPPQSHPALLAGEVSHAPGREEYQRGILEQRDGINWVVVSGDQSSNRLATFSGADCLIRIPKEAGNLRTRTEVEVLPFSGLLN